MQDVTRWELIVSKSPRSGRKCLFLRGFWPDGMRRTSSAVVSITPDGAILTNSKSEYRLSGPDRWGESVQEALASLGEWVPPGQ
jgi:hypothetical protein